MHHMRQILAPRESSAAMKTRIISTLSFSAVDHACLQVEAGNSTVRSRSNSVERETATSQERSNIDYFHMTEKSESGTG
eukprot:5477039-Pleurochrysis_carterae.AAC.1